MQKYLLLGFNISLLFVMLEKNNKSIPSCISSVIVSFTTVTLDVTNTISTWMPHYSTTSAYVLGPERLWHQSENEKVRFAFACQRLLSNLWGMVTYFPKSLQDYSNHANLALTGEKTAALQRLQARRIDTCHWKPGLIFHIPCYSSSRPPGTSWPGTLKQHRKNIISPNCLLHPVPCLTCTSLLHR